MTRRTRTLWACLNALAFGVALTLNGLANALPINGITTGALSDLTPNLFVPMGATFAIWGLIYLWLFGFVVYGFVLAASRRSETPLAAIGPWFVVNGLANAAWIVAWHHVLVPLSLGLMGVLLVSLLALYQRLGIGRSDVSAADRWLVHAPVSLYLGWITVATIANVTTLAVGLGAPSFGSGPAALTVGVLVTAMLIALRMLWARRDVIFAGVVAWAFLGIHLKRIASDAAGSEPVAAAAAVGLGVLILGILGTAVRRSRRPAA